ncbi:hypothetical protein [Trichocoleus sp. FACHB-262]|uniref:hypothetical protein n=1 Tax=Trichocoleus sp. FACHB-262 TaxID=2692869 RepID=UPI0018F00C70|nr:hypothetical protein [Trichocoleus sp. FACHB-262]
MLSSVSTFLSAIVDYAGLFPPAQLSLKAAMANYAQYHASPDAWMLGRFVLPASYLEEFIALLPTFPFAQWPLSIIISQDFEPVLSRVQSLAAHNPAIALQALEFPPLAATEITALDLLPQVETFFEIPLDQDLTPYLDVLRHQGASAKIRTGGITAAAFPSAAQLYEFIFACAQAQVSFKATAGLHHPLPGEYPLTYEPESEVTAMPGFLNVALASALVYWQKITLEAALSLLQEQSADQFLLADSAISWNQHQLSLRELAIARKQIFRSFGSCSFVEPLAGLQAMQLLPKPKLSNKLSKPEPQTGQELGSKKI